MTESGYGLWPLVVLSTVLFAVFAGSFFHPRTGRDWRAMDAFTGFLVALRPVTLAAATTALFANVLIAALR